MYELRSIADALYDKGVRSVPHQEDPVRCKEADMLTLRGVRQPMHLHPPYQEEAEGGANTTKVMYRIKAWMKRKKATLTLAAVQQRPP